MESWLTPQVEGSPVGLVHLWTDQRIPGPVSCCCPSGSMETPPRWHVTIYWLSSRRMTYIVYMSLRLSVTLWYFEFPNTLQSPYLEDHLIKMVLIFWENCFINLYFTFLVIFMVCSRGPYCLNNSIIAFSNISIQVWKLHIRSYDIKSHWKVQEVNSATYLGCKVEVICMDEPCNAC